MIEIDSGIINKEAQKAVRMVVFVRALAKESGLDDEKLADLERGFREAAGETFKARAACKRGEEVRVVGR